MAHLIINFGVVKLILGDCSRKTSLAPYTNIIVYQIIYSLAWILWPNTRNFIQTKYLICVSKNTFKGCDSNFEVYCLIVGHCLRSITSKLEPQPLS